MKTVTHFSHFPSEIALKGGTVVERSLNSCVFNNLIRINGVFDAHSLASSFDSLAFEANAGTSAHIAAWRGTFVTQDA